jgi:hypothetical protein
MARDTLCGTRAKGWADAVLVGARVNAALRRRTAHRRLTLSAAIPPNPSPHTHLLRPDTSGPALFAWEPARLPGPLPPSDTDPEPRTGENSPAPLRPDRGGDRSLSSASPPPPPPPPRASGPLRCDVPPPCDRLLPPPPATVEGARVPPRRCELAGWEEPPPTRLPPLRLPPPRLLPPPTLPGVRGPWWRPVGDTRPWNGEPSAAQGRAGAGGCRGGTVGCARALTQLGLSSGGRQPTHGRRVETAPIHAHRLIVRNAHT